MSNAILEITPLSEKDSFYLVDRWSKSLDFPLHKHSEFELNYVEHCRGVKRIVGDSIEKLGDYDLVLVGHGTEHAWAQGECTSDDIHQITIQFPVDLFGEGMLQKNNMASIHRMLEMSSHGIAFGMHTIMHLHDKLEDLSRLESNFYRVLKLFEVVYELSVAEDARILSSGMFSHSTDEYESRRVRKVSNYIATHFSNDIKLATLADMVSMTPTAFSRFFKLRTGRSVSDYIIDVRLGYAARKLADSTMSIVEICYDSGFNNVSYFNRIFKRKKGLTPTEFRSNYRKTKIIV
ncbi:MAG: helix-turn-helix domain-containing protein [Bacteroidaceae bacterium]|nr:helix-turn-helix domain-containing protein [Bacteroidaceae bacterium]